MSLIPCPQCGDRAVFTLDTRERAPSSAAFAGIRRRRQCRACDHRWMTIELHAHQVESLEVAAYLLDEIDTIRRSL